MKEKIARVLDKLLKRKVYKVYQVGYNPVNYDLGGFCEEFIGGIFGSKEAAEAELRDRGCTKGKYKVKRHHGWDVKPYMKVLWREEDSCGGYFYAVIVEEDLKW